MKLIIDIPEEEYKDLMQTGENTINLGELLDLRNSVRNGTPLDDVKEEIHKANCYYHGTEYGEGIDLCEKILDMHIGKTESEEEICQ